MKNAIHEPHMISKANSQADFFHAILAETLAEETRTSAEVDEVLWRVAEALPFALELQTPPPEVKTRILDAVRLHEQNAETRSAGMSRAAIPPRQPAVQLWKTWSSAPDEKTLAVLRSNEGRWEKTGVEGVEVKQLFVDQARDYVTMLVRMQPGSSYPSHRHGGFEECYVISGDLAVGDTLMTAGDYQRAEGGSVHVVQSTRAGCVLFIVSSQHDELLA